MLGAMAAPPSSGSPSPFPEVIAAIDIGTNSIHMVVARTAGNDRFEVITRLKEMVRLGSGQGEMKHLEPDAIDRAVAFYATNPPTLPHITYEFVDALPHQSSVQVATNHLNQIAAATSARMAA